MSEEQPRELCEAILQDDPGRIREIINSKKEDVNKIFNIFPHDDLVPLTYAIITGKPNAVKALLAVENIIVNPKVGTYPPLTCAMHYRQFECFKILLTDLRVDINASDKSEYKHTPLTYSICNTRKQFFEALLESKREIDVNKPSDSLIPTAIELAVQYRDLDYLKKLLRQPGIKVQGAANLYDVSSPPLAELIRSKLDNDQNLSRADDLRFLEQAIACGKSDTNENKLTTLKHGGTTSSSKFFSSSSPPKDSRDVFTASPGKCKRVLGTFIVVVTPLIYITGGIGIPLGFIRKPQETYEAFEKLHLNGLIDNISESTVNQVMAGMIAGIIFLVLLASAYALIKNKPAPTAGIANDNTAFFC